MSDSRQRPQPPAILTGLSLLARGRPEGFHYFGNSPQHFLASLAPLVAFPLVGGFLLVVSGRPGGGIISFLEAISVLLAQPVISEALARHWTRDELWLRYATAFNWCQWLMPALALALIFVGGMLLSAGLPPGWAAPLLLVVLVAYAIWLQWFLARHGLALTMGRAAALVVLVNLGTAILVLFPRLIAAIV